MKTLVIINDPPYGTERAYNALRLATTLLKREREEARVFLMGDASSCSKAGQILPQGYYSIERMLKILGAKGSSVGVCGTCMDARGIRDEDMLEGTHRSTMEELADWSIWADKVLVF